MRLRSMVLALQAFSIDVENDYLDIEASRPSPTRNLRALLSLDFTRLNGPAALQCFYS